MRKLSGVSSSETRLSVKTEPTKKCNKMSLLTTLLYRVEDIGPTYSIILGSPASGQITDEYRQQAAQLCAAVFTSFTVSRAEGFFRGQREDSLVFQMATLEPEKVTHLAAQLAGEFCQDGVGVLRPSSHDATSMIYSRVIPIKQSLTG